MKPDINQIPDLKVRVIIPRLTQPEEIDQILMAIAARKLVADASYGAVGVKTVLPPPALMDPENRNPPS